MNILIFDNTISGHHLEYIHHIYEYGAKHLTDDKLTFVLPKEFEEKKAKYKWSNNNNIKIQYLDEGEQKACSSKSILKGAWHRSRTLSKYAKRTNASFVVLITLMSFMPFLPFLIPNNIKIRGIIYNIYLYNWHKISLSGKILELLKYLLYKTNKNIDNVFILNDHSASTYLNRIYHTNKFKYLTDPINIETSNCTNIREQLNIPNDDILLIHFGGLTRRKGTMDIIDLILNCNSEYLANKSFVFAGKVYEDIKSEFYQKLPLAQQKANIIVFDEFCSYDFLNNLCYSCDSIIIPYKNTSFSSGILGYASYFKKPAIGPKDGLIGKLIRKNGLGITTERLSETPIELSLEDYIRLKVKTNSYLTSHTIMQFVNTIFDRNND